VRAAVSKQAQQRSVLVVGMAVKAAAGNASETKPEDNCTEVDPTRDTRTATLRVLQHQVDMKVQEENR